MNISGNRNSCCINFGHCNDFFTKFALSSCIGSFYFEQIWGVLFQTWGKKIFFFIIIENLQKIVVYNYYHIKQNYSAEHRYIVNNQLIKTQKYLSLKQQLQNDIFQHIQQSQYVCTYLLLWYVFFTKRNLNINAWLDMLMPKKKFLAKIKTDSFSKSTSSLCECTFLHSSSPQAAAAAWLHQLKLMTETAIHNF